MNKLYLTKGEIIARDNLNAEENKKIKNSKLKREEKCLFTIGYEGRSVDEIFEQMFEENWKRFVKK